MGVGLQGLFFVPKKVVIGVSLSAEVKTVVGFLSELEKGSIYPPGEKDFPKTITDKIKKGKIKVLIKVGRPANNQRGEYDLKTNVLTIFVEKAGEFNLPEKEFLVHELYHAYQDAAKKPATKWSDMEGPAYLLGLKYFLIKKGFSLLTDQAVSEALKYGEATKGWFQNIDKDKMKQFVSFALSMDAKEWARGRKEAAFFQLKQIAFAQIDAHLKIASEMASLSGRFSAIDFKLPGGEVMRIYRGEVGNLVSLGIATQRGTPQEKKAAWIKLTKYWSEEVFVSQQKIDRADAALLTTKPDGVD